MILAHNIMTQGGHPMSLTIRRVVTGHDKNGHAIVSIDESVKSVTQTRPGAEAAVIWTSEGFPVDNDGSADASARNIDAAPDPDPYPDRAHASTMVVTGNSYENKDNLDPRWFTDVIAHYEGTRIGRQEIMAEILADVPGALWTREMLDRARLRCGPVEAVRIGNAPAREAQLSTIGVWTG
jgi:phage terminase large subunit-like protein